jgi:secreted trypsin-like serine protease
MRLNKRAMRTVGVALLASAVGAVVTAGPAQAIAHGEDAPEGAYPFSVSLTMPKIVRSDGTSYASACSAALIAPQWIITAGHCFHDGDRNRVSGPPRYDVTATVGQDTLSGDDGTALDVVDVVQDQQADVALARLENRVRGVEPLPISKKEPSPGDVVRLVGWGATDAAGDVTSRPDHKQTGEFTVSRVTGTEVFLKGHSPSSFTSACSYDSGGPYFSGGKGGSYRLVATEIGGPGCPHDTEETTARSDVLYDWIHDHIAADGPE